MGNITDIIGREPALPLYRMVYNLSAMDEEWTGFVGRVITLSPESTDTYTRGGFDRSAGGLDLLAERLTFSDVVWVPLIVGMLAHPSGYPAPKHPDYRRLLEWVGEVGPRVGAILIGNQGPELSFTHLPPTTPQMVDTVVQVGAEIIDKGGRPAFGVIDWNIIEDGYTGGSLQSALVAMDALTVCFCGYTLCPDTMYDGDHPHLRGHRAAIRSWEGTGGGDAQLDGEPPWEGITQWVRSHEVWSGVNAIPGLQAGNDRALKNSGFAAGFVKI
jgi:hypothetical protein